MSFGLTGAALTLSGLCAFAIAQPLFDLLASNVTFLIAHRIEPVDLLALTVLVLAIPAALVFAVVAATRLASPALARALHSGLVAIGVAAVVLPPLHRTLSIHGIVLVAIGLALGIAVGLAHYRITAVQSFARLLSLGVVGFPLWFLALSPASTLLADASQENTRLAHVGASTPVVFVVFDQFPLFTLLKEDETIDAARYPNFAALAEHADWFRNATTVAGETVLAVPSILTGRYPDAPRLPTYREHPQNLFTLLGHDYHLNVIQTMTDLCPPTLCGDNAPKQTSSERLMGVVNDLGFLYLHVLLPPDLREGLPDIGSTWRDFNNRAWLAKDATPEDPKSSWGDPTSAFERFLAGFDGRRERVLHFLHVNVPHVPWKYLPSGAVYGPVGRHLYPYPMNGLADVGPDDSWALDRALQRHLLQVGFADRMLGELVERLEADGLYDEALLIVTADHGITFWPTKGLGPNDGRAASDVLNVPMFVKRPNARAGRIDDSNVETVDLLPTVAALLGAEVPGTIEGHSLYDTQAPEHVGKRVFIDLDGQLSRIDYAAKIPGRRLSIRRMQRTFGASDDANGLFRIGRHRDWIGRPVGELRLREPSTEHSVELEFAEAFERVEPDGAFVPARITGEVRTDTSGRAPREVAIAVNGVVWATTRTFENVDGAAGFAAMVPQHAFRSGANAVDLYVVEPEPGGPREASTLRLASTKARRRFDLARGPDDSLTLDCTDGRKIPVVAGALRGSVASRGAMLAGFARDESGERAPQTIVVFANGHFYEERDLARARAETAQRAHLPEGEQGSLAFELVIPFEILRESDAPELRVFAVSGGVASELEYLPGFAYLGSPSPGSSSASGPASPRS